MPEPPREMSKLEDKTIKELIAHRKLAHSMYSKIRRVNIISVSNWNGSCEPGAENRIEKLVRKILIFEPERIGMSKFYEYFVKK